MTTLIAPAKLNLFLSVGDVRPDGYHAVTAVNAVLDFGDEVTVAPAASLALSCEPDLGVAACDNLAWKAAEAMARMFERDPDVSIRVVKRIPAGAGLGGGSADAAAVVASLAALWDIAADDPRLDTVARELGVDVALFLHGGCAVYAGRGDVLRRKLPTPVGHVVLVWPRVHVSTADAYRAFDAAPKGLRSDPRAVTDAICFRDAHALGAALFNNMTASSVSLEPAIADVLEFVSGTDGCLGRAMAGSGSAVFGLYADERTAEAAVTAAEQRGWWAVSAKFADEGMMRAAREGRS